MSSEKNQNGFRSRRTTTSQIFALRRLVEGVKDNNIEAILIFIDFNKPFDTVHREMMLILKAYGIPEEFMTAISIMYEDTSANVITPDGETETFSILAGVLQEDTLAPYLFVIVIDYIMRKDLTGREEKLGIQSMKRQSRRVTPIIVTDMDFADDIVLVSDGSNEAEQMLRRVEISEKCIGLSMNTGKTKYMSYNNNQQFDIKTIDETDLKRVEDFKYLGAWVDSSDKDIKIRKAQAWRTCHQMRNIWNSKLSWKFKIRLIIATVESVMLYGCKTWTLTNSLLKKLAGTYTKILRMVLNIHLTNKIKNEILYRALERLPNKIRRRRLKFVGHCLRREYEVVSNMVLWQPTYGTRRRGRPLDSYIKTLERDTGLRENYLRAAMMNRDVWKSITVRESIKRIPK